MEVAVRCKKEEKFRAEFTQPTPSVAAALGNTIFRLPGPIVVCYRWAIAGREICSRLWFVKNYPNN